MKQRDVSVDDVMSTLANGRTVTGKQPVGNKRVRWPKSANVFIEVVYRILRTNRVMVITVLKMERGSSRR